MKKIEEIAEQSLIIDDPVERESFIKRACFENDDCIEQVKNEIPYLEGLNDLVQIVKDDKSKTLLKKEIAGCLLTKKLGSGGMAEVYRGMKIDKNDRDFGKDFAIKVITNQAFSEADFRHEMENLEKVSQHPNIVRLYETGIDEQTNYPYFVLQYIRGRSLTEYCEQTKNTLTKRLKLFLEVCEAVKFLHTDAKIVHCDIKPSNIIVQLDPEKPVLVDFGISKVIKQFSNKNDETRAAGFTPAYSSPELFSDKISESVDIYSLGSVLYELLTNQKALDLPDLKDKSKEEIGEIINDQAIEPPSKVIHNDNINIDKIVGNRRCEFGELEGFLKGPMDRIILKCLDKDPGKRYKTVKELIDDITLYLKEIEDRPIPLLANQREDLKIIPKEIFKSSIIIGVLFALATLTTHVLLDYFNPDPEKGIRR